MANIAQTVNVLQAPIQTNKEKMILTPTYHVFDMYKVHQNADLLPVNFKNIEYNFKDKKIPQISISASINSQNKIHITLCNLNHIEKTEIQFELKNHNITNVNANILTNKKMNAHNTFDNSEEVKPSLFQEVSINNNNLFLEIPPKSIIAIEVN
jgi:alpha-N-arabinofuranosidase